jgi:hypothetical protein
MSFHLYSFASFLMVPIEWWGYCGLGDFNMIKKEKTTFIDR